MLTKIKKYFQFSFFAITILGLLAFAVVQVNSLYYGTPTSRYPQSGYMIVDFGGGDGSQCGVNFVSDKVAITAAHCIDDPRIKEVYANVGTFDESFMTSSPEVASYNISPKYNETTFSYNPGMGDVGVIKFAESVSVSEYGEVGSPEESCNYYLVGYGKNEKGGQLDRTGTDVCIKNITENSFEIESGGRSHFCVGDSGSGIYEKGSNKFVGVVSAFYTAAGGGKTCKDAVAYVAARLDTNMDYLEKHIPSEAAEQVKPEVEKTVPEDYFGKYYPETVKDDGSYNYENEIIQKIDDLGEKFNFYPEEGYEGTREDSDQIDQGVVEDATEDLDDSSKSYEEDVNENVGTLGLLIILGALIFLVLGFVVTVIIIVLVIRRRNRNKQNYDQGQS